MRGTGMEKLDLTLESELGSCRTDLVAVLVGVSGVSAVDAAPTSRLVSVQYDRRFVSEAMLRQTVTRAGYPIRDLSNGQSDRDTAGGSPTDG